MRREHREVILEKATLIRCENLEFSYDREPVLRNVHFEVSEGDYICIVGENGAGKSTLVNGILGLKKPSKGRITYVRLRPNEIGYLPQKSKAQRNFPTVVQEVVLSGCLNSMRGRLFYGKTEKASARQNMEALGIWDFRGHAFGGLSGGQQQRVLLARALCATGKLILLDEPAAGLDPVVTKELYEMIQKINRELGIAVLMVSHDIHAALRYSDKILHLKSEQLFFGSTAEYENTRVGSDFIGDSCQFAAPAHEHMTHCTEQSCFGAGGTEPGCAEQRCSEPGCAEQRFAEQGCAEKGCAEPGSAGTGEGRAE